MLSCECGDYNTGWEYYQPDDFSKLEHQRRKCCSCKKVIKQQETCVEFELWEVDQFGDYIGSDPWYMCEHCGEIYLNLTDLGYCVYINQESMDDYLAEYHFMTRFEPKKTEV